MNISKIKELCENLPDVEPLPLKYGEPKSQFIRELAKKHNIQPADAADFGNIEPVLIDENANKVDFDTNAFFSNKNLVEFWDEMNINGITGETFTNGENN